MTNAIDVMDQVSKRLFVVSWWDGYDSSTDVTLLAPEDTTPKEFDDLCRELVPEAAKRVVEDVGQDIISVTWYRIAGKLVDVLCERGFVRVTPHLFCLEGRIVETEDEDFELLKSAKTLVAEHNLLTQEFEDKAYRENVLEDVAEKFGEEGLAFAREHDACEDGKFPGFGTFGELKCFHCQKVSNAKMKTKENKRW